MNNGKLSMNKITTHSQAVHSNYVAESFNYVVIVAIMLKDISNMLIVDLSGWLY